MTTGKCSASHEDSAFIDFVMVQETENEKLANEKNGHRISSSFLTRPCLVVILFHAFASSAAAAVNNSICTLRKQSPFPYIPVRAGIIASWRWSNHKRLPFPSKSIKQWDQSSLVAREIDWLIRRQRYLSVFVTICQLEPDLTQMQHMEIVWEIVLMNFILLLKHQVQQRTTHTRPHHRIFYFKLYSSRVFVSIGAQIRWIMAAKNWKKKDASRLWIFFFWRRNKIRKKHRDGII